MSIARVPFLARRDTYLKVPQDNTLMQCGQLLPHMYFMHAKIS